MLRKLFGVGALSPKAFVDLVARTAQARGDFASPEIDYEEMSIKSGDRLINLRRIYQGFLRTPRRQRLAFVTKTLTLPELPHGWAQVREQLRPVVRSGAYLTLAPLNVAARGMRQSIELSYRPLVPGLFTTLVIDTPDSMAIVQESQLAEWGVSFEAALEAAMSNLRAISQDGFRRISPRLWMAPWNDSYAAARLVLPEILQRVTTDPLVCVPDRDTLLVADGREGFTDLVAMLTSLGEERSYEISSRIYQLEHKVLRTFAPPPDSPATLPYRRICLRELGGAYAEEKELRDADDDDDAFYASLRAYEREGGVLMTNATWTSGIGKNYLPPADQIYFVELGDDDEATDVWEVPWAVVEATPGMLTCTNAPLPRWRTGAFPPRAWLDANGTALKP